MSDLGSQYMMTDFAEIALLLMLLFSMIGYVTYIIHRITTSQTIKLYVIGQINIIALIVIDLFIRLALLKDHVNSNLVRGFLSMYIAYFFFFFSYQYFIRKEIKVRRIISIGTIPFVLFVFLVLNRTYVPLITNDKVIGALNFVVVVAIFAIILRAIFFFVQDRNKSKRYFRKRQSTFLLSSLVVPLFIITFVIFEYIQWPTLLLLIITNIFSVGIVILAIKFQLIDDTASLLDYIISNMKEGIIIVDHKLDIVDYNDGFFKDLIDVQKFKTLDDLMEGFNEITVNKEVLVRIKDATLEYSSVPYFYDIEVVQNQQLFEINVTVATILDKSQRQIATLLTFHDITDLQELQRAIEEKNRQLIVANEQLVDHMNNVNELFVEQERKLLMDHINDTLGHTMTEILALLELSVMFIEKRTEPEIIVNKLEDTANRARIALDEIRESVSKYKESSEVFDNDQSHDS